MPDQRLARFLARLLPERTARDLFEPASEDLRYAYLTGRVRGGGAWYAVRLIVLFLDCWRLALAGVLWPDSRDHAAVVPAAAPTPREPLVMFLYHVRHAFRQLLREPAFTLAAVLTLALGVGGNVAVFAVVEAVLLRPLPYANADDLVILNHRDQRTGITKEFIAIGDYVDIVARQTAFESVAAYGGGQATIANDAEQPYRVEALQAAPGLLEMLRVRPALGRTIRPEDSRPGAPRVMLLGDALWRERFAGDPGVVGRTVKMEGQDWQVVGVLPRGFAFPPNASTGVVVSMSVPLSAPAGRKNGWVFALARLKPGHTLAEAGSNLAAISRQLEREFPQSNQASEYFARSLRTALLGNTRPALLLLSAAVAVVLLIACANVANLLLARALGRRREMSLRMALGAGRGRLAAQLLAESLALSLVAGAAGVVMAHWGARALVALVARQASNVPGLADVRINGAVLGFTLLVTIATALAFGLVAALTVRSQNAAESLGAPARATMSAAARRATSALVVVEVALAVMLLIGAGLILRSFAGLLAVDPGFRTDHVMTMTIQLPADRYRDEGAGDAFYRRAFAALGALPEVREVGAGVVVPLTGNNWTGPFERPEQPVPAGERPPEVGWQAASGGYFRALRIPLLAGRLFDPQLDRPNTPRVVIVSEAVQRRFFPNQSAVGHFVKQGENRLEIVGVVGNVRRAGLRDEPRADMYFAFEQGPGPFVTLFVRTAPDPERAAGAMEAALRAVEPNLVILESRTMATVASESERVTRLVLWLLGIFAATALALAAVGIYGVMSYVVRQRAREIGTRIALGATRRNILWLVLQQGAAIALLGTAVGLAAGLGAARFLASVMYGVSASDPVTLSGAVVLLVATIMAACWLPARRAAGVDPAKTLAEQ
ncbi:MAG TPA: ABC transporter permease [Gemmatimonadaceae bacterium]|nr:ABC transporter permease [Gemmatimonadaceae bacterium]